MMRSLKIGVAATIALSAVAAVAATPAQQSAVNARKANYKEIGGIFKSINDEIKSGSPDLNTVRPLARNLAQRASRSSQHFVAGSGPSSGLPTRAKALIWKEKASFDRIQQQMISSANALNVAAAAGDVSRMTAARDALGATCKSCHDRYREAS